jgi:hypothetical protein
LSLPEHGVVKGFGLGELTTRWKRAALIEKSMIAAPEVRAPIG